MSSGAQKWQHRTNILSSNNANYKIYVESETFMVREKYLDLT